MATAKTVTPRELFLSIARANGSTDPESWADACERALKGEQPWPVTDPNPDEAPESDDGNS
jgi:hypothetical protein